MTSLGPAAQVAEGQGRAFELAGKKIAVFRIAGELYAIDGVCPHRKGPLAEGLIEGRGIICPWHGWEFDLSSGRLSHDETICLTTYAVVVRDGDMLIAGREP